MSEMEMSSCRRRKSVPEIVANTCDDNDGDKDMLIDPAHDVHPNNTEEPKEPIYSRALLSMDGYVEHARAKTPEEAFRHDLKPDGAFMNLRPKSPIYIPQYQRYDSEGNSVDQESPPGTPPGIADSELAKGNNESAASNFKSPRFKLVRSDSNSGRLVVKIPLDPKLKSIDENTAFDNNTDGTQSKNSNLTPSYPVCMTHFKRGVSPTGQMNLVLPDQPTLSMLRARAKIHFTKDILDTIDLLKSGVSEVYKQNSMEMEIPSPKEERDLLHIMDENGKIIWNTEDNEEDLEDVLGVSLEDMQTMDQEEFQALDPEAIIDAYLTEDYIILETST